MRCGSETMSFKVGEELSEWCPGDDWSRMATMLKLGEAAEFAKCGRVELVSWTHLPREWVSEDTWKVVWRQSETPWNTPSASSTVACRVSERRPVGRPETGDDVFVEPDDWKEGFTLRAGQHESWVESMGRGERASFYRLVEEDAMTAWDAELVDFVESEEVVDCTIRRIVAGVGHRTPGPFDTVRVRLNLDLSFPLSDDQRAYVDEKPIVGRQLYDGDLDEAIATMRTSEIAEIVLRSGDRKVVELVDFVERPVAASDLRAAGNVAFERGDISRALRRYDAALQLGYHHVHTNRAACFIELGDFRNALRACDKALVQDSEDVQALRRKAKAHVGLGELDEARKPLAKCLSLDPDNKRARKEASELRLMLETRKGKMRRALATAFADGTDLRHQMINKYRRRKEQLAYFDPEDDGAYLGLPNRPQRARRVLAAAHSSASASPHVEKEYSWLRCPGQDHEREEEDIQDAVMRSSMQ